MAMRRVKGAAAAPEIALDGDLALTLGGPIEIDGVRFVPCPDRTYEHDIYLMDNARAAGLDRLIELGLLNAVDEAQGKGDAAVLAAMDKAGLELLLHVYRSGRTFDILAGLLVREGTEWSPEQAKLNWPFFARAKDEGVKARLQMALVTLLLGFFVTALASSETSPSSSTPASTTSTAAGATRKTTAPRKSAGKRKPRRTAAR